MIPSHVSPHQRRLPRTLAFAAVAIALFLSACGTSTANDASAPTASTQPINDQTPAAHPDSAPAPIRYETHELERSIVHTVWIPARADARVTVLNAESLTPLDDLVASVGAIAAINAGFFDPNNQQTTSFVRLDGEVVADPRQNPRLIQNPDLAPYMDAILNRSEFRHYRCVPIAGDAESAEPSSAEISDYAITFHDAPVPSGCRIRDSVGAGPQILPQLTSVAEGFVASNESGQVVRDAIGSLSPNARSAIGITAENTLVLIMVAQRGNRPSPTGLSLPELADFLASLGVEQALNLDGGSSTSLYYDGQTHFGRLNAEGQPIGRAVKSVILVQEQEQQ